MLFHTWESTIRNYEDQNQPFQEPWDVDWRLKAPVYREKTVAYFFAIENENIFILKK